MDIGVSLFGTSAGSVAVIALVLAILATAGTVFMLARQQKLLGQYQQLMTGATGGNIEELLHQHVGELRGALGRIDALEQLTSELKDAAQYDLQHVGVVRFNPFRDTGGDQSFAIALADRLGDGLIISSLHARDMTRVYAKPLKAWQSGHTLTEEEKQAINNARSQ